MKDLNLVKWLVIKKIATKMKEIQNIIVAQIDLQKKNFQKAQSYLFGHVVLKKIWNWST